MKKLFLGLLLTSTVALSTKAQIYVQGGLNLANITKTNDGQTEKNNILPSFNVGILGRLALDPMFDLESGVLLTGHGSKAETYTKYNFITGQCVLAEIMCDGAV